MAKNPCKKLPPEQLVILIQSGSLKEKRCAEEALFEKYRRKHVSILRSKENLTKEEAIDVYQEAVTAAIKAIQKGVFRGESTFETYFSRIRDNKVADLRRRKYRNKPVSFVDPADLISLKMSNEDHMEASDFWKEILACAQRNVDDADCMKIFLWKSEGYTLEEIANMFIEEKSEHYHTAIAVQRKRGRCIAALIEKMRKNCPDLLQLLGGDNA